MIMESVLVGCQGIAAKKVGTGYKTATVGRISSNSVLVMCLNVSGNGSDTM